MVILDCPQAFLAIQTLILSQAMIETGVNAGKSTDLNQSIKPFLGS
jgi:hypothetical protein